MILSLWLDPVHIVHKQPDPSSWGLPGVKFQSDCDIDNKFKDHQLIFDTTFVAIKVMQYGQPIKYVRIPQRHATGLLLEIRRHF